MRKKTQQVDTRKKEGFVLCICIFGESLVPRDVLGWALRKLGVEKWLIKTVYTMHRNAQGQLRFDGTFSDDFLVRVGLH